MKPDMIEHRHAFLAGGGEMGARMRAHDWAATPLGAPTTWPEALRTIVSTVVNSPLLGTVLWGPDLRLLYNDAYAPALAERHPDALGRPIAEVWAGLVWDQLGPDFRRVLDTGVPISASRYPLPMERDGRRELTYWNYSVAPISGATGVLVLVLATRHGTWVMPPQRGMWIPPGTVHDVRTVGAVSMQSLYLEPDLAEGLPDRCQVVGITPFLRALIGEALDLPVAYEPEGRAGALMALLEHELRSLVALPLSLPHPSHPVLAERCLRFIGSPDVHHSIEDWSAPLGMSRRAFTRLFRRETGLSFVAWRQQACLLAALTRLASGEPVTAVALSLGYDNPAAFTTMFKRLLGASPRAYLQHGKR